MQTWFSITLHTTRWFFVKSCPTVLFCSLKLVSKIQFLGGFHCNLVSSVEHVCACVCGSLFLCAQNHQRPVANHLSWPAEVLGCLMVGAGIGRGNWCDNPVV